MVNMLEVLTEEGLDHIKRHQYKAGKYTPLDNFLNPYWIQLAEALPRWLAPNLVTLVGFLSPRGDLCFVLLGVTKFRNASASVVDGVYHQHFILLSNPGCHGWQAGTSHGQ